MKYLAIALLITCSSFQASARDSIWNVCSVETTLFNEPAKILVNVFEHRDNSGDGRQTELALIYGSHILEGNFDSTNEGPAKVTIQQKSNTFVGTVTIDYIGQTMSMKGTLNLSGSTPLDAAMTCEEFGN